jgi:hypothetical protein
MAEWTKVGDGEKNEQYIEIYGHKLTIYSDTNDNWSLYFDDNSGDFEEMWDVGTERDAREFALNAAKEDFK